MELTLESGRVIADATEADILSSVEGEDFAILGGDPDTYIQCAEQSEPPYEYILEYQEGSLERHYRAADGPVTLDRVIAAFIKYLRRDSSWRSDFRWERITLSAPVDPAPRPASGPGRSLKRAEGVTVYRRLRLGEPVARGGPGRWAA